MNDYTVLIPIATLAIIVVGLINGIWHSLSNSPEIHDESKHEYR